METFYMFLITLCWQLFRLSSSHANLHWICRKNLWGTVSSLGWGFHTFSLGTLHFDRNIVSWRNSLPFPNLMPLMTSTAHTIFRYSYKSTLYCSLFHCKVKKLLILFSSLHLFFYVLLTPDMHFCISWFSLWPTSPLPTQLFPWVSALGCVVIPSSTMLSRGSRVLLLGIVVMLVAFFLF